MKGIDTNVLVRFYINDEAHQFQEAQSLFSKANASDPIYINHTVIVEWFWVLSTVYGVSKYDLIKEFSFLLQAKEVTIKSTDVIQAAFDNYKELNADFADCLIGILNKQQNCQTTYTFDKEASKLPDFTILDDS